VKSDSGQVPILLARNDPEASRLVEGRFMRWDPASGEVKIDGCPLFRALWPQENGGDNLANHLLWNGTELVQLLRKDPNESPSPLLPLPAELVGQTTGAVPFRTVELPISPYGFSLFDGKWLAYVTGSGPDAEKDRLFVQKWEQGVAGRRSVGVLEPSTTQAWWPLAVIEQTGEPQVLLQYFRPEPDPTPPGTSMNCAFAIATFHGSSASWERLESPGPASCHLQTPGAVRVGNRVFIVGVEQVTQLDLVTRKLSIFLSGPIIRDRAKQAGAVSVPDPSYGASPYLGAWGDLLLVSYTPAESPTSVVWAMQGDKIVGSLFIDSSKGLIRLAGGARSVTVEPTAGFMLTGTVRLLPMQAKLQ
jgi:hypothetical protein